MGGKKAKQTLFLSLSIAPHPLQTKDYPYRKSLDIEPSTLAAPWLAAASSWKEADHFASLSFPFPVCKQGSWELSSISPTTMHERVARCCQWKYLDVLWGGVLCKFQMVLLPHFSTCEIWPLKDWASEWKQNRMGKMKIQAPWFKWKRELTSDPQKGPGRGEKHVYPRRKVDVRTSWPSSWKSVTRSEVKIKWTGCLFKKLLGLSWQSSG